MELDALINYGAIGIVLLYFIYKDNTTTKALTNAVQELREVTSILKEKIDNIC